MRPLDITLGGAARNPTRLRKLTLREYISSDSKVICQWITDPRFLLQWAGPGFTYPMTPEQFSSLESNDRIKGYTLADEQTVLGYGEIIQRTEKDGLVCRVIVADSLRGTGAGKQLIEELVEEAFKNLALEKLTLNVFDFNESAIRCYKSVGFKETNRLEGARDFEGEKWSLVVMELHNPNPA
ncbi:MAG: GNAT family protein [Verrucomicrobiales bacterium]|nr:GNAT family protein [Verrucomicrobiales bacterium]